MFTIIIPTIERHSVLLRAIEYYQHFKSNIVIVDSSVEKLVFDFPDNVIYKHLPGLGYAKKISVAAENIKTPYVCMSADDDYLIESSLRLGVRFLDENPDFVSVQGRYLKLELVEGRVVFSPRYSEEDARYTVTDEDSFARVVKAYHPYMHHFYSIHRTDIFYKSFRSCVDISICVMVELTSILVPMCYGKHKALPMLWMVRDSHKFSRPNAYQKLSPEKSSRSLVCQVYRNHNRLIEGVKYFLSSEESQLAKDKFANNISDLVGSEKECGRIFNAAFKSYVTWVVANRNKVILKNIIKSIIPAWLLNYYMQVKTVKLIGGDEKDALERIRLSVLSFVECYSENK
jgi:glycosyltransferase domain-containing protein